MPKADFLWLDGKVVRWKDGVAHVSETTWWCVFEAIRAYPSEDNLNLFRLDAHLDGWRRNRAVYHIPMKYSKEEIIEATRETIRANDFHEVVRLRLSAWIKSFTPPFASRVSIVVRPFPSILPPSPAFEKPRKAVFTAWRRIAPDAMPPEAKCLSNYANSVLALLDARRVGADTALFLDRRGFVSEAYGACLMAVKRGRLLTPPTHASIPESITRDAVLTLAEEELGIETEERDITRVQLYGMDEVFQVGTAFEVSPITEIDGIPIGDGNVGPMTRKIAQEYTDIVRGKIEKYSNWLIPVY